MYVAGLDYDKGIAYLEDALRLYETLGNEQRAAQMHSRLGRDLSSFITLDIGRALEHYRAAEPVLSKGPETIALGAMYGGMATALSRALSADEAAAGAERTMEIGDRLANEALWGNGAALLAINRLYQGLGQNSPSQPHPIHVRC